MPEKYCMHMIKWILKFKKPYKPPNPRIKCPNITICCYCCRKCTYFETCLLYTFYKQCLDRGIAITKEQLIVNVL